MPDYYTQRNRAYDFEKGRLTSRGEEEQRVVTSVRNLGPEEQRVVSTLPSPEPWSIDHIVIEASSDGERRVERLNRVLGYVLALARDGSMFAKVSSLYDHEGDLTVTWSSTPTGAEKSYFDQAWQDGLVGDGGGPARHEVEAVHG